MKLKSVKASPSKQTTKVVDRLREAAREAEEQGYTQLAVVMSKLGTGYSASFCLDDSLTEKTGEPTVSVYHLLGTVGMLRKFIEETAADQK